MLGICFHSLIKIYNSLSCANRPVETKLTQHMEIVWINRNRTSGFVLPLPLIHWQVLVCNMSSLIVEMWQTISKWTEAQRFTRAQYKKAGKELLRCTSTTLGSSLGSSSIAIKLAPPRSNWLKSENLGNIGWELLFLDLEWSLHNVGCSCNMSCHVAGTTYINI